MKCRKFDQEFLIFNIVSKKAKPRHSLIAHLWEMRNSILLKQPLAFSDTAWFFFQNKLSWFSAHFGNAGKRYRDLDKSPRTSIRHTQFSIKFPGSFPHSSHTDANASWPQLLNLYAYASSIILNCKHQLMILLNQRNARFFGSRMPEHVGKTL